MACIRVAVRKGVYPCICVSVVAIYLLGLCVTCTCLVHAHSLMMSNADINLERRGLVNGNFRRGLD